MRQERLRAERMAAWVLLMGSCLPGCGQFPPSILGSSITGLIPGNYDGDLLCSETEWAGNVLISESEYEIHLRVVVGPANLPLDGGQSVAEGVISGTLVGTLAFSRRITHVDVSENAVTVTSDVYAAHSGPCADTCPSAFNGSCDDGGPNAVTNSCTFGTDCSDCGPSPQEIGGVELRSFTGREDGIDFNVTYATSYSNDYGIGSLLIECTGILAP